MPNLFNDNGKFVKNYNEKDMAKFEHWVRKRRDESLCYADILKKFHVSPGTAYRWMEQARKNVSRVR